MESQQNMGVLKEAEQDADLQHPDDGDIPLVSAMLGTCLNCIRKFSRTAVRAASGRSACSVAPGSEGGGIVYQGITRRQALIPPEPEFRSIWRSGESANYGGTQCRSTHCHLLPGSNLFKDKQPGDPFMGRRMGNNKGRGVEPKMTSLWREWERTQSASLLLTRASLR